MRRGRWSRSLLSLLLLSWPLLGHAQSDPRAWPAGFPPPAIPADNPLTEAKIQLGRALFYDPRLSGNGTQSCASCHQQAKAFTDGRPQSFGSTGARHLRNAMSLANVVYSPTLTWANPQLTRLEDQVQIPLFGEDPVEMGVHEDNSAEVLNRLSTDAHYPARFAAAFPGQSPLITWAHITQALASFQRILLSGNSRYDQAQRGELTLTAAEQRGHDLFFGEKAECFHCHGGHTFSDQVIHADTRVRHTPFHNTGTYNVAQSGRYPEGNQGLYELTGRDADRGRFRAPTLRNIAVTAPYLHDGSVARLSEVIDLYAAGGRLIPSGPWAGDGRRHPNKSPLINQIRLTRAERADLLAFLETLTDVAFLNDPRFSNPFDRP